MEYKVLYEDNSGSSNGIDKYKSEELADAAIDDELENVKEWLNGDYDYSDNGIKVEIWSKTDNAYASWTRLWKEE